MQVQLVSKLREVNDNPALSKQFYKAISLCDAFLHSCDNTDKGLEQLKVQVKDVIAASVPKRTKKAPTPKAASRRGRSDQDLCLQLIDASRAHF